MGSGGSRDRRQQQSSVVARATRTILREDRRAPDEAPTSALALVQPRAVDTREIRATQMRRGGQPFTKADLVAILSTMTGEPPERLLYGTCSELRIAIRIRMYTADPAAVVRPAAAGPEVPPPYAIESKSGPAPTAPPSAPVGGLISAEPAPSAAAAAWPPSTAPTAATGPPARPRRSA